jgi:hypothetical protein
MPDPLIHGNRQPFSASLVVQAIATSLSAIRTEDKLTFSDIGAELGKSEDQAAKYCDGTAVMDAVTLVRGMRAWDGRFGNSILALINRHLSPNDMTGMLNAHSLIDLTKLLMELQIAFAVGDLSISEIKALRPFIEAAGALIDSLRAEIAKL